MIEEEISDISYSSDEFDDSTLSNAMRPSVVNEARQGFCFNFKKNMKAIGESLLMKEIYYLVIFFIASAIIQPSFGEFSYFFLLNIVGISKLTFAVLMLVG